LWDICVGINDTFAFGTIPTVGIPRGRSYSFLSEPITVKLSNLQSPIALIVVPTSDANASAAKVGCCVDSPGPLGLEDWIFRRP
jgi:hypothetical protein